MFYSDVSGKYIDNEQIHFFGIPQQNGNVGEGIEEFRNHSRGKI